MSEVKITPEQGGDSPEHIAAMVAKAEGRTPEQEAAGDPAPTTEQAQPERPAWLPEKFKSPEDMAKAYAELEGKLGGKENKNGEAKDGEAGEVSQEDADKAAQEAVEQAGLDMEALGDKLVEKGELDDSDYEALAKAGISRQMVDAYVAGQQALGQQMVERMHQTVGGEETFNSILEWAGENLSADEIEAFNDTVDNGSESAVKLALEGLHAKFKASGNSAPNLLQGTKPTANGDVFRSTAELVRAMNDPRYAKDPAYRADVEQKLARSSIF